MKKLSVEINEQLLELGARWRIPYDFAHGNATRLFAGMNKRWHWLPVGKWSFPKIAMATLQLK